MSLASTFGHRVHDSALQGCGPSCNGRVEDDTGLLRLFEVWVTEPAEVEARVHVGVHHKHEVLLRTLKDRLPCVDTSIIHQDVELPCIMQPYGDGQCNALFRL